MPVPKRKTSPMKRDQRRNSRKLKAPSVNTCPNCKSPKKPHHVCGYCGHYAGKLVIG